MFEIIPGSLAKTTSPEEVGRATGELCTAMARVKVDCMQPPIAPYFDLFKVHHAINGDAARFYREVRGGVSLVPAKPLHCAGMSGTPAAGWT